MHLNFLDPIRSAFKAVDEGHLGFVDRVKATEVLSLMDKDRELDVLELVESADPGGVNSITFSSMVRLLAEKTVTRNGENLSLLQLFYDKEN